MAYLPVESLILELTDVAKHGERCVCMGDNFMYRNFYNDYSKLKGFRR